MPNDSKRLRWVGSVASSSLGAPFWISLAVLLVNDHVLKGGGWLPGWLTGKLSDFAGLLVLPLLLAASLRARTDAGRLAILGSVAAGFSLIQLSRPAADAAEALFGALGIRARVWCDPSDLTALAVLPVAFRLMSAAPRGGTMSPRATWNDRMGVALGGLACVATTAIPEDGESALPILMNHTRETIVIERYVPAEPIDCLAAEADPRAALSGMDFVAGTCAVVEPWKGTAISASEDCGALVLSAPGLDPVVVYWPGDDNHFYQNDESTAFLYDVGDRLYVNPAPITTTWDYERPLPKGACAPH